MEKYTATLLPTGKAGGIGSVTVSDLVPRTDAREAIQETVKEYEAEHPGARVVVRHEQGDEKGIKATIIYTTPKAKGRKAEKRAPEKAEKAPSPAQTVQSTTKAIEAPPATATSLSAAIAAFDARRTALRAKRAAKAGA